MGAPVCFSASIACSQVVSISRSFDGKPSCKLRIASFLVPHCLKASGRARKEKLKAGSLLKQLIQADSACARIESKRNCGARLDGPCACSLYNGALGSQLAQGRTSNQRATRSWSPATSCLPCCFRTCHLAAQPPRKLQSRRLAAPPALPAVAPRSARPAPWRKSMSA